MEQQLSTQQEKSTSLPSAQDLQEAKNFADIWLVEMEKRAEALLAEMIRIYKIQDDAEFLLAANESHEASTQFLAECREVSNSIKEARLSFTKTFDNIKSYFATKEKAVLSEGAIGRVVLGRNMTIKRISFIDQVAKVQEYARLKAEREAKEEELVAKGVEQNEAAMIAEITTDVIKPIPTFKGNIITKRECVVTSQAGYATLFNHWFAIVGSEKDIEELGNFKLSSLLVWANKYFKESGSEIVGEGIGYQAVSSSQVRAKKGGDYLHNCSPQAHS